MSDWKSLPSEVLNIIFLYLKKSDKNITHNKDLSECALICRGWRDASQAVFFSYINVRDKNDINKLLHLLLVNNNLRRLIKTLCFNGSLKYSNDFAILLALDMQLPNLESLHFSGDNLLYSSFTKIVAENGNFKNLRRLPTPQNTKQDQIYLQSIASLKDRITTIEMFDDPTADRNSYSDLRERLNVFPDLEEIVVYTSKGNMFSEDFMQHLKFIADMKLKSLKKISIVSLCNDFCLRIFTLGQQALFSATEPKNIHVIIKSLFCTLPSQDFMLFIKKTFFNTNSFRLEHDFRELQGLQTPSSTDLTVLLWFLRYLSAMPNFLLQNIVLPNEDAFKLIKGFYTTSEKEATSAKPLCRLKIESNPGVAQSNSSSVSFQKINSREQNINITLNSMDSSQYSYEVKFQQLVQQVGRFLEKINFEITTKSRFDTFFNTVLANCPQLNELVISGYESLSKELFLFNEKSKRNNCNKNIKSLTLLGFTPTQMQLINLLDQLPNLERLSLTNLFLKSPYPSREPFFSICLPNASLKCLEVCIDDSFSGVLCHSIHSVKIVTEDLNQKILRFFFEVYNRIGRIIENIPEVYYQDCLIGPGEDPTCLIFCKSLEKFTIRYLGANNEKRHKELDLLPASP